MVRQRGHPESSNSTEDLRQAIIGKAAFTDEKYTGWYNALDDMVKKGYFNEDVMSLDLDQGVRVLEKAKPPWRSAPTA